MLDARTLSARAGDRKCLRCGIDAAGGGLYSLAEFNQDQLERLGPSLEAGYPAGRFGAIPFVADRVRLGWSKAGE